MLIISSNAAQNVMTEKDDAANEASETEANEFVEFAKDFQNTVRENGEKRKWVLAVFVKGKGIRPAQSHLLG